MLSRRQGQIIDVKCVLKPFWKLSENDLLVTCITNLKRIMKNFSSYHAHKVKLSTLMSIFSINYSY